MVRVTSGTGRLGAALLALLALGCTPAPPPAPQPPAPVAPTRTEALFPVPYFPVRSPELARRPAGQWSPGWTAACEYRWELLTPDQRAFVQTLGPAGGEGTVALGFSDDADGDGRTETVRYGAWARGSEEGNFVLITGETGDRVEVLLLQEIPGPPAFTVFTRKPDGSLWFGGGIDAGEVTMSIVWTQGKPEFRFLTPD